MLRVAIAEDEAESRAQLTEFLRQYGETYSVEMEVSCFSSGVDLVQDYRPEYDIILLDIAMPDMDGMETARHIRQVDEQAVLVFITQMAQYAINGYEVDALDFLLKPVNYDVFAMKLTKAIRRAESREGKRIVLTLASGVQVLQTRDIYYVEIQNHVLHYHTNQGEFALRGTMQKAEQELAPYHFSRCSNWCLVNLAYVSQVDKNVAIVAGTPLDISRRNRTAFMAALTRYMGGQHIMVMQTYWINFCSYMFCWGFCLVFLLPLPRRRGFPLWAAAFLLCNGLLCLGTLYLTAEQCNWLIPVELLASATLMALACCKVKASIALYFGIWSVLCVALLEELYDLPYLHLRFPVLDGVLYRVAILMAVICIVGGALALTERKWMPVYGNDHVGPRQLTSAVMLYMIFMVLLVIFYNHPELTPISLLILIGQAYCVTLLYLQTALFKKSALQQEVNTLNLLWQQQKRQYEFSRENIARVNQKYHDLKHTLAAVRSMESNEQQRQALQEIEDSVHGYDLNVNTNNETLNTVLTEKQLECDRKGITVNCVVDGASVDFMNPVDLYTIMGNAMDNAMEAVSKFERPHLRIIDVLVHVRQRFLVISITNPMKEPPSFEDGLPVSTKKPDGFHGFGIRSIRSTVQKYGGETVIDTRDGFFCLSITIPLPEETQDT